MPIDQHALKADARSAEKFLASQAGVILQELGQWKQAYSTRMAALAECVELNFDRCMNYVVHRRFAINEYHVIPSAVLKLPYRGSWTMWLRETCMRRWG